MGAITARNSLLRARNSRERLPNSFGILLAHRPLTTETSTAGPAGQGIPPGFKLEEAKKPLPVDKSLTKPKATPPTKTTESTEVGENLGTDLAKSTAQAVDEKSLVKTTTNDNQAVGGKKPEVKLTLWQKVKKEAIHFWDGTKLLGVEIKISWKLALKMAAGYELTRREQRQVDYL